MLSESRAPICVFGFVSLWGIIPPRAGLPGTVSAHGKALPVGPETEVRSHRNQAGSLSLLPGAQCCQQARSPPFPLVSLPAEDGSCSRDRLLSCPRPPPMGTPPLQPLRGLSSLPHIRPTHALPFQPFSQVRAPRILVLSCPFYEGIDR